MSALHCWVFSGVRLECLQMQAFNHIFKWPILEPFNLISHVYETVPCNCFSQVFDIILWHITVLDTKTKMNQPHRPLRQMSTSSAEDLTNGDSRDGGGSSKGSTLQSLTVSIVFGFVVFQVQLWQYFMMMLNLNVSGFELVLRITPRPFRAAPCLVLSQHIWRTRVPTFMTRGVQSSVSQASCDCL